MSIDFYDVTYGLALLFAIGYLIFAILLYKGRPHIGQLLMVIAAIVLTYNRVITCLISFDIKILSQELSSSIGAVTIGLLLASLVFVYRQERH
jgi:hypothetical protein